jgi:hypothetical protein
MHHTPSHSSRTHHADVFFFWNFCEVYEGLQLAVGPSLHACRCQRVRLFLRQTGKVFASTTGGE